MTTVPDCPEPIDTIFIGVDPGSGCHRTKTSVVSFFKSTGTVVICSIESYQCFMLQSKVRDHIKELKAKFSPTRIVLCIDGNLAGVCQSISEEALEIEGTFIMSNRQGQYGVSLVRTVYEAMATYVGELLQRDAIIHHLVTEKFQSLETDLKKFVTEKGGDDGFAFALAAYHANKPFRIEGSTAVLE